MHKKKQLLVVQKELLINQLIYQKQLLVCNKKNLLLER